MQNMPVAFISRVRLVWGTLEDMCLSCMWDTFALEAFVCLGVRSREEGGRMLLEFTCAVVCCGSPCVISVTLFVFVCVCTLSFNTGPSQHVWPCSCSRANFSCGCAYASVPLAWPMRDEDWMGGKKRCKSFTLLYS